MVFEKPAAGNQHQFTVKQHFHTAHSIGKFHDIDGKLDVHFKSSGKVEKRHKRSSAFYTKRNWDQKAEVGLMAEIEKLFHDEIDSIKTFESRNHDAISEYFLLWGIRYNFHISRLDNSALNGVAGSGLTKAQEEVLEGKGAMYVRDAGVVPARFITGSEVLMQLDQQRPSFEGLKWGLLKAMNGQFIVADCYKDLMFMPISPDLAFCVGHQDMKISEITVADINRQSIEKSSEFYFAKDLSLCPISS